MLAVGLAHAPGLTHASAEMLIPCVVSWFLENAGIPATPDQIANLCPNKETIANLISDVGASVIIEMKAVLSKVNNIYLACDKCNMKTDSYFVKILCWYDEL